MIDFFKKNKIKKQEVKQEIGYRLPKFSREYGFGIRLNERYEVENTEIGEYFCAEVKKETGLDVAGGNVSLSDGSFMIFFLRRNDVSDQMFGDKEPIHLTGEISEFESIFPVKEFIGCLKKTADIFGFACPSTFSRINYHFASFEKFVRDAILSNEKNNVSCVLKEKFGYEAKCGINWSDKNKRSEHCLIFSTTESMKKAQQDVKAITKELIDALNAKDDGKYISESSYEPKFMSKEELTGQELFGYLYAN